MGDEADLQHRKLLAEIEKIKAETEKAKRDNSRFYRLAIPAAAVVVALSQAVLAYVSVSQTVVRSLDDKRRSCVTSALEIAKFSFQRGENLAPAPAAAPGDPRPANEETRVQYVVVNSILAALPDDVKLQTLASMKPYVQTSALGTQIDAMIDTIQQRIDKIAPKSNVKPDQDTAINLKKAILLNQVDQLAQPCPAITVDYIRPPEVQLPAPTSSPSRGEQEATPGPSSIPAACAGPWTLSVYPQIVNTASRGGAEEAMRILSQKMVSKAKVFPLELVSLKSPVAASVRFYYENQKDEAVRMAQCLSALAPDQTKFTAFSVGQDYNNLPKGRVEVWFAGTPPTL